MCTIAKLTSTACAGNTPGTAGTGYMAPSVEFASWPAYQAASTPGDGKTVLLDGNFSFTGAGSGKGYFRSFPMLLEKGSVQYNAVGGLGSKSLEILATFHIPGMNSVELEWLSNARNIPGVYLITDNEGVVHTLGSKTSPAYLSEAAGTTGAAAADERGTLYTIRWVAKRAQLYTGTINETPIT